MADFEKAYAPLAAHEGGWVHHPADRGGETYTGISRKFFPSWSGWKVIDKEKNHPSFARGAKAFSAHLAAISLLTQSVKDWFYVNWWLALSLGSFPQALADEMFEQSIHLGKVQVGKHLQRVCNAWNLDQKKSTHLFTDLKEDGLIGKRTVEAVGKILATHNNLEALVQGLNCLQGAFYLVLAANHPDQRVFTAGWMKRIPGS